MATKTKTWNYPKVRRTDFVENLHGREVPDPYRWLEEPASDETKAFVEAQNEVTFKYLETCSYREKFRESLTKMFDYEKFGCPFKYGDNYYYFHNSGLQAQDVLYQLKGSLDDTQREEFFNPNTLEADGTAALNVYSFSNTGNYFSYGISKSGSDWVTVYVRKTTNDEEGKKPLPDIIEWVKFSSLSWTVDDKGFFYHRYPEPENKNDKGTETDTNLNSMLYYHRLGTSQSEDILIFKDPDNPQHSFSAECTLDGRYIVITTSKDTDQVNKLYLVDLKDTDNKIVKNFNFIKLVDNFDAEYSYLANDGPTFYFKTNLKAPRCKVVKYDLENPQEGFVDVVEESEDVLSEAQVFGGNNLVCIHMHNAKDKLSIFDLRTGKNIDVINIGISCVVLSGRREQKEFFYKLINFSSPSTIYRYDLTNGQKEEYKKSKVEGINSDRLQVEQEFVESKDGTRIPVFIIKQKNLKLDGNNPTLIYGYGGFNISLTPLFSTSWISFIQRFNGVVVIANIRGGGEYGEEWHKAGCLDKKQNVFDDFQSVAKWLIQKKYTSPKKLAINGGSNGGLLVGACINQAPELFGSAVADVGVMDMLRFHKFTIGHAWRSDYGDPDKKEDFEFLYKYSPVHNVQSEKPYPAVMLATSDHDDRVVPLHSYKYISELQHVAGDNPNPQIIRIETKAGHGAGKPTKKRIEEATDKYCFIAMTLNAKWVD